MERKYRFSWEPVHADLFLIFVGSIPFARARKTHDGWRITRREPPKLDFAVRGDMLAVERILALIIAEREKKKR